ncbi:hypothetical protein BO78DRAFT_421906 [Aspergillus sclerotiicarbonarius CBS 121057]|uniref:Uncharacterized protein n=1 Tax=Aspergillus sclerotiicarbonarius (strain CBS 121057 / IBT 28362) TaxID=1448318 RepID=A0A319DZF3_ASPSB|nr:hypothetical protein BO78DRAFT_421906 [Aspergillus sclerotiicarbonarius CBS 121057]
MVADLASRQPITCLASASWVFSHWAATDPLASSDHARIIHMMGLARRPSVSLADLSIACRRPCDGHNVIVFTRIHHTRNCIGVKRAAQWSDFAGILPQARMTDQALVMRPDVALIHGCSARSPRPLGTVDATEYPRLGAVDILPGQQTPRRSRDPQSRLEE